MALYEFDDCQFTDIPRTTFSEEKVFERDHLQSALKENIAIVAKDCLVIAEEYSEWSGDSKRRIDLLAIDKDANIVVIELKRDETGTHMELQSLRYAAMISSLTFSQAVDIYKKYLLSKDCDTEAEKEILNFLGWDEPREDEFACDVKILLVSSDFHPEITSTVLWLNNRNIDIRCLRLIPYKADNKIIVDVQQIIPLPESSDYIIKAQKKSESIRKAKSSSKDYTKYKFNGHSKLGKGRLVLEVVREYVLQNPNITYKDLVEVFPANLISGSYDVVNMVENIEDIDPERFFKKVDDIIKISDCDIVICREWGGLPEINNFIEHVKKSGFDVTVDE